MAVKPFCVFRFTEKLCNTKVQASALLQEKLKGIRSATADALPSSISMPGLSLSSCSRLGQALSKPPAALEPIDAENPVI